MTRISTVPLGQLGEDLACRYLIDKGYRIIARNVTIRIAGRKRGEIDIIASYDKAMIFVEVKTRRGHPQTVKELPEANITRAKIVTLRASAERYLRSVGAHECTMRFDAVSILYDEVSHTARIRHLRDIFL